MTRSEDLDLLHKSYVLISALSDAMDTARNESISIPFGTGICGHVAETKETIYIKDAYNVRTVKTVELFKFFEKTV